MMGASQLGAHRGPCAGRKAVKRPLGKDSNMQDEVGQRIAVDVVAGVAQTAVHPALQGRQVKARKVLVDKVDLSEEALRLIKDELAHELLLPGGRAIHKQSAGALAQRKAIARKLALYGNELIVERGQRDAQSPGQLLGRHIAVAHEQVEQDLALALLGRLRHVGDGRDEQLGGAAGVREPVALAAGLHEPRRLAVERRDIALHRSRRAAELRGERERRGPRRTALQDCDKLLRALLPHTAPLAPTDTAIMPPLRFRTSHAWVRRTRLAPPEGGARVRDIGTGVARCYG